jgi:glycosyltransferase involved in cell wall biosynthesis
MLAMKILVASVHRNIVGGVETYLRTLIPALLERGHQVAGLFDYHPNPTLPVIDSTEAPLPAWYCEDLRRHPELWREIEHWRPDVVYAHGLTSLDVDRELQRKYPAVTYLHTYWGTCATGRKCHAFPQIQTCTRAFGPACLLLHYPRRCGGLNPLLALRMYDTERERHARLLEYASILVASAHMYQEFQRNGVSAGRLHLLRLPVDEVPRSRPSEGKIPTGKLLFLGRLTDLKGVDFLIRAIPAAQKKLGIQLTLTVGGDGAQLGKLKALACGLGVAVTFAGWVSGAERLDLLRRADLLVVPSLWPEPFGMVGVEAGCVGLPSAGFAVGGIPDWLIPGQTGELAPSDPPTVEGLAGAMVRALADPAHYNRLSRGAFELSQRFTLERHLGELETILSAQAQNAAGSLAVPQGVR